MCQNASRIPVRLTTSHGRLGVEILLEQGYMECDMWTGRQCPKGVLKLMNYISKLTLFFIWLICACHI